MNDLPRIFLTRELPPKSMTKLQAGSRLVFNQEDRCLTKTEIIQGVRDADGLLCLLTDTIDDEILAAGSNLKVVSNFAVGFNNIDVASATRRKIPVTNTPGVLTDSTADMTWALLMDAARRVSEGDRLVRSGTWSGWGPLQLLGADISGATLGLVGLGRIGKAVARRAMGFEMNVKYWNRTRLSTEEESRLGVEYASLKDLLAESDYVSVHVALNEATRHLIGAGEFESMKPTACLINTARGPIVDEKALVAALQSGKISRAGLDVYEREPSLEPELSEMDNVVLAPHLGSATIGTRTKMGNMAVENCLMVCAGDRPVNLVNPDAYV
ncbi:D-glycerate dehydrogenase [bacterium]|nr:D-glycerate dehydrogenase [Rubripirellula sp.]MDC0278919.1 D-glycerate dehydrogenase [bacterium]